VKYKAHHGKRGLPEKKSRLRKKTRPKQQHFCRSHPSREAVFRCTVCGARLCERCARTVEGGVVCSRRCRMILALRRLPISALSLLRGSIPPLLAFTVPGFLAFMLLLGLFRLHGELVEVSSGPGGGPAASRPSAVLRKIDILPEDNEVTIRIEGPPRSDVLLQSSTGELYLLKTDGNGLALLHTPATAEHMEFHARTLPSGWQLSGSVEISPTPVRIPAERIVVRAIAKPPFYPTPRPTPKTSLRAPATPTHPPAVPTPSPVPTTAQHRPRPTPVRNAPPVLHLVTDGGPRIALTFDGGASANRTAELLDLLQSLNIRATLFLTGEFIEKQPALVRRAVLAGHEIGNHSYSHPHLTTYETTHTQHLIPGMTREIFVEELRKTERVFRKATGRSMAPLWRAPYGEENPTLRAWALEAGYLHVRWSYLKGKSLDTLDWVDNEHSSLYRDSRQIVERLLRFPHLEGGIVLMHLSTDRREVPWAHLPEFIEALHMRHIEAVRVSVLLENSPTWRKWLEKARKRHHELYE